MFDGIPNNAPLDCDAKWQQYRCTMQQLGQGPVNAANSQRLYKSGRFGVGGGWVGGGWRVVVVGSEPVHDSLHVTYRLLAPGTEPSRGPQPIKLKGLKET